MSIDVVIVGAGPTGLMLACELALAGVRLVVLERLPEPSTEPKANGLLGQVVRVMDHRGLIDPPLPNSAYFMFGGLALDLGLLERSPVFALPRTQRAIEQMLEERAAELGVRVRRGHELVGLSQDEDGVTLRTASTEGSEEMRARFVVGADGAHSAMRKLAGIDFPGVHHDRMTVRSAHVALPEGWVSPAPAFLPLRTEHGGFSYAPLPGQPPLLTTTEWDQPEPAGPMTLAELGDSIRRVLGTAIPLAAPDGPGPHVLRRMTGGHTRVASRYADRRVFLIGDAAHVFGAAGGGPGLNLGLQDAVNLGWKLALAVRGDASGALSAEGAYPSPELLDSYETERRAAAADRMIVNVRAQAALIAPGSDVTGLRDLVGELLTDPAVVSRLAHLTAGADVHYDMGPDSTHPVAGRFCPDLTVDTATGPQRIAELTHAARPLLVDATPSGAFAETLPGWTDRIDVVRAQPLDGLSALLLRPDCYVAWASSTSRPGGAELSSLRDTVTRWFGAPSRPHELLLSDLGQQSAQMFLGEEGLTGLPLEILPQGDDTEV